MDARARKRPREDDDLDLSEGTAEAFAERMRTAVTQGTVPELVAAVERATPAAKSALVAAGGLRRFRQWLRELLKTAFTSDAAAVDAPPEHAAQAEFILKLMIGLPIDSQDAIVDSGVARVVGDIANSRYRVPSQCSSAAAELLGHWAESYHLGAPEGSSDAPPAAGAAADPRMLAGVATPSSAGPEDEALPALVGFGDAGDADGAAAELMSLASFGDLMPEEDAPAAAGAAGDAVVAADHQYQDGKPDLFGEAPKGVLINRKRRLVGGRPWAPRSVALSDDAKEVPPAAVEAKERRRKGIVFAKDHEIVRVFLQLAPPASVAKGDPSEEDVRRALEAGHEDDLDEDEATGNVEERRRREQESERGRNVRDLLAHGDDEDDSAGATPHGTAPVPIKTSHVHVPPPPIAVPPALRRTPPNTQDRQRNEEQVAAVFVYHTRSPAAAPRTPAVHPGAWDGFSHSAQITPFPAPAAPKAASAAAPRAALSGLQDIVAKLSRGRGSSAAREDGRDASQSRRSASPGDSLARSASGAAVPQQGQAAPRAPSRLTPALSMLLSRVQGVAASAPGAAQPRGGLVGSSAPTSLAPAAAAASARSLLGRGSLPATATAAAPMHPSAAAQQRPQSTLGGVPPHPSAGGVPMHPSAGGGPPPHPSSSGYMAGGFGAPAAFGAGAPGSFGAAGGHPGAGMGLGVSGGGPGPGAGAQPGAYGGAAPPAPVLTPGMPLPRVGEYDRAPYDQPNWWHLLPEEMPPVNNTPNRAGPCHFFPTIQGCQMGARCGFKHDPHWTPSRAPKGVDRLWPKFLTEILPRRRERYARAGAPARPPASAMPQGAPPSGPYGMQQTHAPRPQPYAYGSGPPPAQRPAMMGMAGGMRPMMGVPPHAAGGGGGAPGAMDPTAISRMYGMRQ